jgi:hypothetical protein
MRTVTFTLLLLTVATTTRPTALLAAQSGQPTAGPGTLLRNAPMFLIPDAGREPLVTLATGTVVNVLGREGDWYRVTYRDSLLGERTGYIQAANVRVEPAAPRSPTAPRASTPPPATRTPQPQPAPPQRSSTWIDRGYVSLNALYQATSNGFTGTTTFTQNVEPGTATATFDAVRPPILDVGGGVRLWRDLALDVSASWLSKRRGGTLSANIPHPFLFNAPRTVTGSVSDVPHDEVAVHVNAAWLFPVRRGVDAVVFGGPSYFHLTQGLVTDVASSSTYPFDTATFTGATVSSASRSRLGYNLGLDLTVRMSRYVGVGALVRYSHASVPLPAGGGTELTVRAGGLQVGGGIRFRF